MRGSLFTQAFLEEGILDTDQWKTVDEERFETFRSAVTDIFSRFPVNANINEADTEKDVIWKVLEALGWQDYLAQQTTSSRGRSNIPDVLLFKDAEDKRHAQEESSPDRRYLHGLSFVESKKWQRPLDRAEHTDPLDDSTPSNQMLRYLTRVEIASRRRITWGVLTNGRHWRLYWQGARARAEEFLELDLPTLVGMPGLQADLFSEEARQTDHYLRVFYLVFSKQAFLPDPSDVSGRTFHQVAWDEGRHWEARISDDLSEVVFRRVFPDLIQSLVAHDPKAPSQLDRDYLAEVREAALTFLYRLLFLLYAEDRNLLPVNDTRYDDYSFRKIRQDIADRVDVKDTFSATARRHHSHLQDLFTAIDLGDASIGLPPYNGGLFETEAHPVLDRTKIPDAELAPILDNLCRLENGDSRKWINFRDLSVQHLGSVYERLLEFDAKADGDGNVSIVPNSFARRTSGSYYTHETLVKLIIEQSVGPLVNERIAAFEQEVERFASDKRAKKERLRKLEPLDPASRLLELKICDPAMGSGHFLVSLVDYLADRVLEEMDAARERVPWASKRDPYQSPLAHRIVDIREQILATAEREGWIVPKEQLDDRCLIRRIILKRVIFGVDRNPMAVELAKLALWLHTFTAGAPLSFLDHHLRCGDSLMGESLRPALDELRERGALLINDKITQTEVVAESFKKISLLSDADISEVKESKHIFDWSIEAILPMKRFLDFWAAVRWLPQPERGTPLTPPQEALTGLLDGRFGNPFDVVARGKAQKSPKGNGDLVEALNLLLEETDRIAKRERFLHWEIAFPGVWHNLNNPQGGFDAVIGNPPWDRIKLQEVEWFAGRRPEIAAAGRAADRKKLIEKLKDNGDPLWEEYTQAAQRAEKMSAIVRSCGRYPLLARGDINIYSLFVEQSGHLVSHKGIVGLLTPSGISADKTASEFFQTISTTGRLKTLFDFENKKFFFPDVHASFKFCALVFGGKDKTFAEAQCAFYLHRVEELAESDKSFVMGPEDFAAVNPNTGTAPIFRSRRDAEITKDVYSRLPVLIDRRVDPPTNNWGLKYSRMFDMTNDSGLFKRQSELEKEGFYPTGGNRWKRGKEEMVPLYVGRMINRYDHRAAGVHVNEENVHNPALSSIVDVEQKADATFVPMPQFWVDADEVQWPIGLKWLMGFRDIARATDARTAIAGIVPFSAVGNTLPLVVPENDEATDEYIKNAPLLLANLNSYALDYIARQKVQSTHLNWYVIEQFPVLPPETFDKKIGNRNIGDFVREQVLHLTYTAVDMEPFARDMGYKKKPFKWNDQDRRHRMARLDALFFHLYGIARDDADYILDTFPIVREHDEKQFGDFRTKRLVLAYMNAIAAGDLDSTVDLS